MRSEPWIIAGMAKATLGNQPIDWAYAVADYNRIRDMIADVIPGFARFNERLNSPGGFHLEPRCRAQLPHGRQGALHAPHAARGIGQR